MSCCVELAPVFTGAESGSRKGLARRASLRLERVVELDAADVFGPYREGVWGVGPGISN